MSRLVAITDQETALGLQLAGIEVIGAGDLETARLRLSELLNDVSVGLIAISSGFLERLDDSTRQRVEKSYRPVVVALPVGGPLPGLTTRADYLASLIRRAIGFHITFPGVGVGQSSV